MDKAELRKVMKRRRSGLSAERILMYSGCIAENLVSRQEYADASVLLAYVSFSSEVNTHFLIDSKLEFQYIRSFDDLAPGKFGIPEPVTGDCVEYAEEDKCLLLLPGIAYTDKGDRLGYGGGYYDRYLKKHDSIPRAMLAYSLQKADTLPVDEKDVPADMIITEIGCIETRNRKMA